MRDMMRGVEKPVSSPFYDNETENQTKRQRGVNRQKGFNKFQPEQADQKKYQQGNEETVTPARRPGQESTLHGLCFTDNERNNRKHSRDAEADYYPDS
jgi:hypothetical protein